VPRAGTAHGGRGDGTGDGARILAAELGFFDGDQIKPTADNDANPISSDHFLKPDIQNL
jgi:hypothetical protein